MIDFLFRLPLWVLALVLNAWLMGFSLASLWAFRYSSEGESRSLFYSTRVDTLRELHPEVEVLHRVSDESRLVVSEPLRDLAGAWNEVPESHYGIVQAGQDELRPFTPQPPG